jgi:CAP12/Pycsar effector protein, TIR domain
MTVHRRVFFTSPRDKHLGPEEFEIKKRILELIRSKGYEPQLFFGEGLPKNMSWSFSNVRSVMQRCCGAVILGLPRWTLQEGSETILMPSEFTHYEGAVAHACGLPVLTIALDGIPNRAVFWRGGDEVILTMPSPADRSWIDSDAFKFRFAAWLEQLEERRDVFLGYCSKGKLAAQALQLFLTKDLELKVLDWEMDFRGGSSILEEIESAATKCTGGIFLFTKDEELQDGEVHQAAPRDNVVLEAGYFIRAKGKERVLIVREAGAKMPADMGGTIYAALPNQQSTSMVESAIRRFVENQL